jgi:hypothetical protein
MNKETNYKKKCQYKEKEQNNRKRRKKIDKRTTNSGRKLLLNKEMIEEICKYVSNGLSFKDSVALVNISEAVFYKWQQYGKTEIENRSKTNIIDGTKSIFIELIESIKKARIKFKAYHLSKIRKAADKQWQASAWSLERQFPDEFGKHEKIEFINKLDEFVNAFRGDDKEEKNEVL